MKLEELEPNSIYSVDETGVFVRLLPNRTYITNLEDRKSLRRTKNMSAKDLIKAYINATCSRKVPPPMLGKAKIHIVLVISQYRYYIFLRATVGLMPGLFLPGSMKFIYHLY